MRKRSPWFILSLCCALCFVSCATNMAKRKLKAEAFRHLGERYLAQRNVRGALKEFLKAEALYDENYLLQNDLGLAYSEMGKLDLALKHFEKALDLNPDYAGAWNNIGTVYIKLEEWDKAIGSFNRALDQLLYATPHFALNNLGEAYRGKKDYERSVLYYRKALHAEPRFVRAHRGLALTYMEMGDYDRAVSSLEKAVEYAPDYALAYYDLGRAYIGRYNREKALSAFKKVIALVPNSPLADAASAEMNKLER